MAMPFVALLRMIEDAIRLLNKEITARLGSALEVCGEVGVPECRDIGVGMSVRLRVSGAVLFRS